VRACQSISCRIVEKLKLKTKTTLLLGYYVALKYELLSPTPDLVVAPLKSANKYEIHNTYMKYIILLDSRIFAVGLFARI